MDAMKEKLEHTLHELSVMITDMMWHYNFIQDSGEFNREDYESIVSDAIKLENNTNDFLRKRK